METTQVVDVFRDGIGVVIRLAGPMLLLSMTVGVLTAIIQAVTQIHEQTISFILKLVVVGLFLVIGGDWMLGNLQEYARELLELIRA